MVGKKKWSIFELCLVRAMLKASYSFLDIVDHFPKFFPEAKHAVGLTSVKHVEKEYLSAEPYISLEAQWEDIPGKKGYLLALYALGLEFSVIVQQISTKYPSHKWPEFHSKTEAVDMAISTFHACIKINGGQSLSQAYASPADPLVACVLLGAEAGDSAEVIHGKTGCEVPFDHVVFILTRFTPDFWIDWEPAGGQGRMGAGFRRYDERSMG